ncbi:MAG TPA: hypothetical protein DCL81_03040, partial [Algoriphagus sp.]|nr:hypothetical protein [Algoriphagus sp.]
VNEGKQMLWMSNRDGLRSYATSGRSEEDVYMLFFDKAAWDKFNLSKEEFDLMKEIEKSKKKDDSKEEKKDEKKEIAPLKFDWDG